MCRTRGAIDMVFLSGVVYRVGRARAEDTERVTRIRRPTTGRGYIRIVRSRGKSVGGAQSTPQSIYCVTVHGIAGMRPPCVTRATATTRTSPEIPIDSTDISSERRTIFFSFFFFFYIIMLYSLSLPLRSFRTSGERS